ncbi:PAS domain S-box protein [Neptuniibacter sp. PT8_73]|uniref:PAS domain-containing sensor histidine kinase n=1 Tax=unclassified Neptuniibacter TaxID=2630693 RepID=UPI0039F6AFE2
MSDKTPSIEALQKRIQELEDENELLSDFAGLSSDWFWEQDASFRFVRFWGMLTEKLQRKQSLFIGKRRWEMPIQGLTDEELQVHINCYEKHLPFRDFEYEVPGNDGVVQHYSVSGKPAYDREGNFSGYRGVGRNLTLLHNAQQAVKASQQQLSQILQGSPIATFVIDKEHKVTHWNKACEALTGVPASEAIGRDDSWRGFYAESRPTMADLVVDNAPAEKIQEYYGYHFALSSLINGACEAEDLFPNIGPSGHWLHFNASPLLDTDGNTVGAIETLQDITDRVKAEQAEKDHHLKLKRAHEELQSTLQQLVEAKKLAGLGRLVSGVAHELNSPLGNILLGLTTAQNNLEELQHSFDNSSLSQSQLRAYLETEAESIALMDHNLNRSINLINRFKELSSDTKTKITHSFSLHAVAKGVFGAYLHRCKQRHIELANSVPSDLNICSNEEALEQILVSLLENSLNHAQLGEGSRIELAVTKGKSGVEIDFSDNGQGMDEKVKEHAFDPFFSSKMGHGTSGLGLYRVYNLVSVVLGGSISLLNNEPGLLVKLTLPDLSCE